MGVRRAEAAGKPTRIIVDKCTYSVVLFNLANPATAARRLQLQAVATHRAAGCRSSCATTGGRAWIVRPWPDGMANRPIRNVARLASTEAAPCGNSAAKGPKERFSDVALNPSGRWLAAPPGRETAGMDILRGCQGGSASLRRPTALSPQKSQGNGRWERLRRGNGNVARLGIPSGNARIPGGLAK